MLHLFVRAQMSSCSQLVFLRALTHDSLTGVCKYAVVVVVSIIHHHKDKVLVAVRVGVVHTRLCTSCVLFVLREVVVKKQLLH